MREPGNGKWSLGRLIFALLALAGGLAWAGPAAAAYPDRTVKIIVPFAVGGITDVAARMIATELSQRLGQSVVVENKPGAAGTIGAAFVAKAPPNGYTIFMGASSTHALAPALNPDLPYDPVKDFAPIVPVISAPNVLVVRPDSPYRTLGQLIEAARADPGKLTHGGTGVGASPHLSITLLKQRAGVDITDVFYTGAGPAQTALLGGHITMTFDSVATSRPKIEANQFRPLAVTSATRLEVLPDVPTVAESGYPGYEVVVWFALWAPAGTSPEIVQRLNVEVNQILKTPAVANKLKDLGAVPMGGTVEEFTRFVNAEILRWAEFVKTTGMQPKK